MPGKHELLARESLKGLRLGISVSESADLARLGLVETHLRLAVAEVARGMLVAGARILYGGHLDPNGYTSFLRAEMEKYSRRDRPLTVCLAWQEHRRIPLADLAIAEEDLGLYGTIVYLSADGQEVARGFERTELAEPVEDPALRRQALTALREHMTAKTHARLLVGGKRAGFQGFFPGVLEEALLSIRAERPLFLAGGFGGVTLDVARVLGLDPEGHLGEIGVDQERDAGLSEGLAAIETAAQEAGWRAEQNGLSLDENLRLAATHRPSEVASLVALGLGRSKANERCVQ
jgi:SLOG cluster2